MNRAALAGLILTATLAFAQAPLYEIRVTGNQRFRAEDIIAASGLRLNQAVTTDDFDSAIKKLSETGLFTSVNYRYDPKISRGAAGFALTLEVVEQPAVRQTEIDIPGLDGEKLWQDLKRADPLITPQMPDNERAAEYYRQAIQNLLRQSNRQSTGHDEIVARSEADLSTGSLTTIFLPASLPKIGEVVFTGNQAIATADLERAIAPVAPGQDFTERTFRRLLDLNVKPLYEEKGCLTAAFTRVTATGDPAIVTVEIQEGPVWTLGQVQFKGDRLPVDELQSAARFPIGKIADWKEITASVTRAEQVLRHRGFLEVASQPLRSSHPESRTVDLTIQIDTGRQFLFGALEIDGFPPARKPDALKLWTLRPTAPLDELYVDEYVVNLLDTVKLGVKLSGKELRVRPGTTIVDVILTFQPQPAQ